MRLLGSLALAAVLASGAEADRTLARAQAHGKRGREALAKAVGTEGSARLHALRRAVYFLSRAEELAAKTTDVKLKGAARRSLVDALVKQGAAHYQRRSLPRARASAERALALDPSNAKAKALLAAIRKAEDEDIFESVDGVVGIDRVRARRLAAGVPLRDRGVARRR
jgi:hypothetical protein